MKRRKMRLGDVPIGKSFYWNSSMCFGGEVIEQQGFKTLIIDYDDGRMFSWRADSADTTVYVEK